MKILVRRFYIIKWGLMCLKDYKLYWFVTNGRVADGYKYRFDPYVTFEDNTGLQYRGYVIPGHAITMFIPPMVSLTVM
jgi:hypothetical protein